MMSILTVNHLNIVDTKTNKVIVKDASFTVEQQTCLGIVGRAAAGSP